MSSLLLVIVIAAIIVKVCQMPEIRGLPHMSDHELLELEKAQRSVPGSPEAATWERAQWAFERVAAWTSVGIPRRWDRLSGMDRAVWHDVVSMLDKGDDLGTIDHG